MSISASSIVPLAFFAATVFVLTLLKVARVRDLEEEVRRRLHAEDVAHQQVMRELEKEFAQVCAKASVGADAV